MRLLNLLLLLFLSTSITAQKIELHLPNQNADSLSIASFTISVDTISKDLEVLVSDYSRIGVYHKHRRYKTSLYELDTVVLIINKDSTQCEVRFLMCDGREFKVDDPYKEKIRSGFTNKKKLRLGFWQTGAIEKDLNETIKSLNLLIPKKKGCNSKRDLRQFLCHDYLIARNMDGIYSSGIQMPSLDGSNSVISRHAAVQKKMDECLPNVSGKQVFKLNFIVDEKGNVLKPFCFDCPREIREKLYDCITQTKWKPGIYDDKNVKSECNVLVGFNVEDKYVYFEQKAKEPDKIPKPVHIPDIVFGNEQGKIISHQEEVFKIVEQMPQPVNEKYFEELRTRAIAAFPNKKLNEVFQFIVEKDGFISNLKNVRSTDILVSEWIIANVRASAKFTPGKQRGRAVRVEVTYRIRS